MRKTVYMVILFSLFFVTCEDKYKGNLIEGEIVGADGSVPPLAHVQAFPMGATATDTTYVMREVTDGEFTLNLPSGKLWTLIVTAVNHQLVEIPLVLQEEDNHIEFRITLAANELKEDLDDLRITGDWNAYSFAKAEKMKKNSDGSFTFSHKTEADTLAYQIVNATVKERTINGTQSDRYFYDGAGDYVSVVNVKNKQAQIVFDPALLPEASDKNTPKVEYKSDAAYLTEYFKIAQLAEQEKENARQHLLDLPEDSQQKYDYSKAELHLLNLMNELDDEQLKKFTSLHYAELVYLGMPVDTVKFRNICELMPLDDPLWAAKPFVIIDTYHGAYGKEEARKKFQKEVLNLKQKKIRAILLLDLTTAAKESENDKEWHHLYNELVANYDDILDIRYILRSLNPNENIKIGKPLPKFLVKLHGKNEWIDNDHFKGKYLLLNFWASWSEVCTIEISYIRDAYKKYKRNNFTVLTLSLDPKIEDFKEYLAKAGDFPWPNSFLFDDNKFTLGRDFSIETIPRPILIDPEGIVVAVDQELRGDNLDQTLSRILD